MSKRYNKDPFSKEVITMSSEYTLNDIKKERPQSKLKIMRKRALFLLLRDFNIELG